jgi:hypothetical protein
MKSTKLPEKTRMMPALNDSKSTRGLENMVRETCDNSRFIMLIVGEIYCISNSCMSYLNQLFTKILEYFSPVEIERKHSTDFANRNILGLVEHSLLELEKLCDHHDLEQQSVEPDLLYLSTKIETIKARLIDEPTGESLHQRKPSGSSSRCKPNLEVQADLSITSRTAKLT